MEMTKYPYDRKQSISQEAALARANALNDATKLAAQQGGAWAVVRHKNKMFAMCLQDALGAVQDGLVVSAIVLPDGSRYEKWVEA